MIAFTIIGRGGREYALASLLARSHKVYSFGGSDAIRRVAEPLDADLIVNLEAPLSGADLRALLSKPESIIVFGPEQPMAAGWVDQIRAKAPDARVLGPDQCAAQLESSKWWAKEFMTRNKVPTGAAERIESTQDFDRFAAQFQPPYVIKADGLAAGKGVAILREINEARSFVEGVVSGSLFGAPQAALIEEYLAGPELSIFLLLDGEHAMQIGTARDYKRAFDGDEGPNTGGMGSFTPVPDISDADQSEIYESVLRPILDGLRKDDIFYRGFLYVGLIRAARGFNVLEFNVRMGDPETQAVLPVLGARLPALLEHATTGRLAALATSDKGIKTVAPDFHRVCPDQAAVCVVLASEGYPGSSPGGLPLSGLEQAATELGEGAYIFHAGTKRSDSGWVTNGGRVLNMVGTGSSVAEARRNTYNLVSRLPITGLRYRKDIAANA